MKSMSISPHGRSRLYWVCRWRNGRCRAPSPEIHIFAGENVCIHAITPMQLGLAPASTITARIDSGVIATGFPTTRTGISRASSRAAAISAACVSTARSCSAPYMCWLPQTNQASRCPSASGGIARNLLEPAAEARDHQLGELLERRLVHRLVDGDATALHHVDAVAELEEVG